MNPKIILFSLAAAAMLAACSDANEPEIKEVQVNGFKEQDPAGYAAYTAALREWKATGHQVSYARLDNAPAVSVSERDFLRSLPDSLDFVAMRRSADLSQFDRQDMDLVRNDFATKVLYYLENDDANAVSEAVNSVNSKQFDGIVIASIVDNELISNIIESINAESATIIYDGSPSVISQGIRDRFDYYLISMDGATQTYDIQLELNLAMAFVDAEKILFCVIPTADMPDTHGYTRNAAASAAYYAKDSSPQLGGIAINNVSADYYDPDIIYKRTRGAIQLLNPAAK